MSVDPKGRLVRALGLGGAVRIVAVEARRIGVKTADAHGLRPGAARLAAEGVVATALMSAQIKGDERLSLQIQAESPRFAFTGEIDAEGGIRARLTPSTLHADRIDGIMLAIKSDSRKELYRGATEIREQRLEEALSSHLSTSSQVDAILRVEATLDEAGELSFAGGYVIERLPESLELPSVTVEEFHAHFLRLLDVPVEDILVGLAFGKLAGEPVVLLEDRILFWRCRCSQSKVESTVAALGNDDLLGMIEEGGAEVTCHFCNAVWRVEPPRLRELMGIDLEN